ncbi:adenylyltransferase/cytidyltransferase family protein, partial [Candidatus Pelagibacter ubique]|nr:adenylyltransferase/cytidyltransferase family protein [Candidatus Pelagibacter ubique]
IGYTTGVFDLFHIGHLNILKNCKSICDKLIVGVTVDELVKYKYKKAVIPFSERIEIVRSCRYVDTAIPQNEIDKFEAVVKLKASYLFVGDDWYKTKKWKIQERKLKKLNCQVIYFPYTRGTSSSIINKTLINLRKKINKNLEKK